MADSMTELHFYINKQGASPTTVAVCLFIAPVIVILLRLLSRWAPLGISPVYDYTRFATEFSVAFGTTLLMILLGTRAEYACVPVACTIVGILFWGCTGNDNLPLHEYVGLSGKQLSFLNAYRAGILLLTGVCILAVDFPVFPRSQAKTLEGGFSVMDVGAGSFVIAHALTSKLATSKLLVGSAPDSARSSATKTAKQVLGRTVSSLWAIAPLVAMGFGRLVALQVSGQEKRVEEYGVHWNFFFTLVAVTLGGVLAEVAVVVALAVVGVLITCIRGGAASKGLDLSRSVPMQGMVLVVLGLVVAGGYQLWLDAPWECGGAAQRNYDWMVRDGPRDGGIIDENREGTLGAFGYVGAWCVAAGVGRLFMARRPSSVGRWRRVCAGLCGIAAVTVGVALFIDRGANSTVGPGTSQCEDGVLDWFPYCRAVSRRVVNLPFVLWLVGVNLGLLGSLLAVELCLPLPSRGQRVGSSGRGGQTTRMLALPEAEAAGGSVLLLAVNSNGLPFFLVCNLLVGATKAGHAWVHGKPTWQNHDGAEAIAWVVAYGLLACGAAWTVHSAGIRIDARLLSGKKEKVR